MTSEILRTLVIEWFMGLKINQPWAIYEQINWVLDPTNCIINNQYTCQRRASLTDIAALACLCIYLSDDDLIEVEHVGGIQVTNDYLLRIAQYDGSNAV
jgi:hypothetical protein